MSLPAGTRLGAYEIVALVGAGGMGEVYRARDTRLNRDVAIKILPDRFGSDAERIGRFQREAELLASLNHPNIAQIFGLEHLGTRQALVLEFVNGPTLADRIAQGPLPVGDALSIARQMIDALDAAHESGVMHRDLKPANIKLTPDGKVKVLDFGLAKALRPDPAPAALSMSPTITSPVMTGGGVILGTAAYMSPEQAKGKPADKRSDVWSFGCVLYEMLTGKRAFAGNDVSDTIASILRDEPDWKALPRISLVLDRLLRRCLQKERAQRLADIADARLDIEEALAKPAASGIRAGASSRVPWMAAAAFAIVAIASLAVALRPRPAALAPEPARLDLLTPPSAEPLSFALSPDGRQIVFVANQNNRSVLWLRSFGRTTPEPLDGTANATFPFWSPGGSAIAFFAEGKLKVFDIATRVTRAIADAPSGRGGTWSRQDVIVFAPNTGGGLMRVATSGENATMFMKPRPGENSYRWPQFLPDGRRFLFSMVLGQMNTRGTYVTSVDGGEPVRVTPSEGAVFAAPSSLVHSSGGVLLTQAFDPDTATVKSDSVAIADVASVSDDIALGHGPFSVAGDTMAYRSGGGIPRQLEWMDRSGRVLGTIGPPDLNAPALGNVAADEQHAAMWRSGEGNVDIWIMDLVRGVSTRFTTSEVVDSNAIFSPDGKTIAFRSVQRGANDIFEKPAAGGAAERPLLVTTDDKAPMDWSPDGRFLLYSVRAPVTGDIWALPTTGDRKPFPIEASKYDETSALFSPDGRWIAFVSNESGHYEVYVRPFPESGGRWQVSISGGTQPRWSKNGGELFYLSGDSVLMVATVHADAATRSFRVDRATPLFKVHMARGANVNFATGAQYAVMRDGRLLVNVMTTDAVTSPITIAMNWKSAVGK